MFPIPATATEPMPCPTCGRLSAAPVRPTVPPRPAGGPPPLGPSQSCPLCGTANDLSAAVCIQCGESFGPPADAWEYEGIGGWLILVAIGVVLRPIVLLWTVLSVSLPVINESWSVVTTPGTEAYHPLFGPLLMLELLGNLGFALWGIVIAVLFFQKKRIVPAMLIAYLIGNTVFLIADVVMAQQIPLLAAQDMSEAWGEVARGLIACAIWVPYFLVSKRVEATFIR